MATLNQATFSTRTFSVDARLVMQSSDARLFRKNKQVNLRNKPKIGNLTEKQDQIALAGVAIGNPER